MGKRIYSKCIILCCFLYLVAACGDARPDATPETGANTEVTDGACSDEQPCPVGFTCLDDGTCAEDGLVCATEADCDVGLLCDEESGSCVECLSDESCELGDVCQGGTCVAPETGISDNGEIGSPDGDEESDSSGFGCSTDGDCSYGVCDFATGYCVDCRADLDCPGGYLCDGGYCVESDAGGPDLGDGDGLPDFPGQGDDLTPCDSQADCDASCTVCNPASGMCESCSDTLACGGGLSCVDPGASLGFEVGTLCLEDANNPISGLACFGGALPGGGTLPGGGSLPGLPGSGGSEPEEEGAPAGAPCSDDDECASEFCDFSQGICMGCFDDSDCDTGLTCYDFMCVSDGTTPEPEPAPEEGDETDSDVPEIPGDTELPGSDELPLPEGDAIACMSQSDCDASCTVCNLATNTCETCEEGVLECGGGLTCASVPLAGNLCLEDPNDSFAALQCSGVTDGTIPGFP